MNVEREDSDCSETEEDGSGTMTTDKFGNSITKKAASGNLAVQKQRAEAKVRREAKAAAAAEAKASKEAERAIMKASKKEGGGGGEQTTEEKIEALRLKMESGAKVSNKDKKVYKKLLEKKERDDDFGTLPEIDALANFSLTVTGTGSQALDGTDDTSSSNSNARQKDVVFKGVSISAPSKPLIVNADVKLIAGRRYGLIGANGRGKSTLLKFLALRKLPHNVDALLVEQESSVAGVKANATVLEQIIGADEETSRLKRREIGLEAQLASTDDDRELEAISSELSEVGSALEAAGFNTAEARARKILSGLGFDDVAIDSPVTLLSGGWQVRAALAASFLVAPSLLLLDEPTNHLDLDAVLWLEDFLGCSQGDDGGDQVGMAQPFRTDGITLVVSHDREFLDATCTDLILLTEDGDLEYHRGGLARLDQGKERRSAKRKKDYALQQKTLGEIKSKHPALSVDKIEKKVMEKLGVVRLCEKPRDYKVNFDFKSPEDGEDGSVGLRDVDFTYEGGGGGGGGDKKDGVSTFSGFKNLNFTFTKGLRACIVGANGTGKSTFLKLLA
jgi:ATP-binding cassette subfamily F protein 1